MEQGILPKVHRTHPVSIALFGFKRSIRQVGIVSSLNVKSVHGEKVGGMEVGIERFQAAGAAFHRFSWRSGRRLPVAYGKSYRLSETVVVVWHVVSSTMQFTA